MKQQNNCEVCVNYCFDEDAECYTCCMQLDEDDMQRFLAGTVRGCPYFRFGDEYTIVRKQN